MAPVIAHLLGDVVVVVHLAFIALVVAGGLLVLRWRRAVWLHLPVAVYGAAIEIGRWTCPLTPLENDLRRRAGRAGYSGGFIEHYLLPVIYPAPFPTWMSWALAGVVIVANVAIYALVLVRCRRDERGGEPGAREHLARSARRTVRPPD